MNDLYDHSQWRVPDSIRTIGDDGNYEVAGYRLINGGKLYDVAPEVPPLGKYLIGISIKYFHNSSIYEIPFVIFSIIFFYLLTGFFFTNQNRRYLITILFALTPQIIANSYRATLDLPQMCMLLAHVLFVFKALSANSRKSACLLAVAAGISAGCFVSIKIGLFIIPILIADGYILHKNKKVILLAPILCAIPIVYFFTNLQFFIQGGSIAQWIAAQKWIINFYRNSNTGFVPFMVMLTMTTSLYKGWWNSGLESSPEWSIIMPTGLGIFIYQLYKKIKLQSKTDYFSNFLLLYLGLSLLLLSLITFWPRYLVLVVPFILLLAGKHLPQTKYIRPAIGIISLCVILQAINLLFPQPTELATNFQLNMQNRTYQEVYGMLDSKSQAQTNRDLFWRELLEVDKSLQSIGKKVAVNTPFVFPWQNFATLKNTIVHKTPLGELSHEKSIKLVRINNRWKVMWNWEIILPHYSPSDTIETKISEDPKAHIQPFIFIRADKIENENELVYQVGELTNIKRFRVIKKYLENSPPDWDSPIGFAKEYYNKEELQKIISYKAVSIKQLPQNSPHFEPTGVIALQKKDGRRFILLYKGE